MAYTLEIIRDDYPMNPRTEWDNVFTLYFTKNNYIDGDETLRSSVHFDEKDTIVFPVYAYIHGAVCLSTSPFSCPWDSGKIGIAVVSKKTFLKEFYGAENKHLTRKRRDHALDILKSELSVFQRYIDGDVWGYVIKDEHGNTIDSCFGYYGGYEEAKAEAEAVFNTYPEAHYPVSY